MEEQDFSREPQRRFRVGSVTAAIWVNNGAYSVTLQKSYKDDGGTWCNTATLFHGDVVCAMRALERAETFIASQQK